MVPSTQSLHSRLRHQAPDGGCFSTTKNDSVCFSENINGFAASNFDIDWQQKCATCPAGKISSSWSLIEDRRGNPVIKIKFAVQDCRCYPVHQFCTHTQSSSPRLVLTVRPEPQYQALQVARQRQATQEFKTGYSKRAGIEGTLSQGIQAFELRRARYRGMDKVHLQQIFTATALNFCRIAA